MAKEMKKRLPALLLTGFVIVCVFFFLPRKQIICRLKIDTGLPVEPDLIAVLGGGVLPGGKLGNSTRERLDAVIGYIRESNSQCPILVQEYPAGRRKMVEYLVAHGVDDKKILSSGFRYREERGGTENNIEELFHVLNQKKRIHRIVLVTSPYHQKRVHLMLGEKVRRLKNSDIYFYFLQLRDDGEISRCSRWRFWHLVLHETFGIFFQRLKE